MEQIISPPDPIQGLWAQVPPDIEDLSPHLAPVFTWLKKQAELGDFVLIQGEFGATYLAVKHACCLGLIPVYSTTSRQAVEELLPEGRVEIRHVFSHVRYRRYVP